MTRLHTHGDRQDVGVFPGVHAANQRLLAGVAGNRARALAVCRAVTLGSGRRGRLEENGRLVTYTQKIGANEI